MNARYRNALIAATLLLFACGAYAQETSREKTGVVSGTVQAANNPPQTMTIRFSAPLPDRAGVKGAPYSAEQVSDHTQTLATYNHLAHRFAPPAGKANGVASHTQTGRADSAGTNPAPARQAVAPAPGQTNRPEQVTESLGTQVIEGVQVEGKKTTTTFPVGSMGNDRPLVRVMESWHSPELSIAVAWKSSDPRMGESTMQLQNIDRTELDPALFRVPPDYQVVGESGDQVEIKITRP